jgi:4-oxalocrotonate tautomerase
VGEVGESIRPHTWVVLEEIKSGNWGIGGTALGLADVHAIQAAAVAGPPDLARSDPRGGRS